MRFYKMNFHLLDWFEFWIAQQRYFDLNVTIWWFCFLDTFSNYLAKNENNDTYRSKFLKIIFICYGLPIENPHLLWFFSFKFCQNDEKREHIKTSTINIIFHERIYKKIQNQHNWSSFLLAFFPFYFNQFFSNIEVFESTWNRLWKTKLWFAHEFTCKLTYPGFTYSKKKISDFIHLSILFLLNKFIKNLPILN